MPTFAPAHTFAGQFGVKTIVYGPPGSGKTPMIDTAPRPVLLAVEPGMLTMKKSAVPTCMATTPEQIDEFFRWFFTSQETRNYDTLGIDSGSQIAEIILEQELGKKSKSGNKVDGKAAYGEMARRVMEYMNGLYYTREKHIYIIAKQGDMEVAGIKELRPYFPGKDLNIKIPHLFDEVLHLAKVNVPNVGEVKALRTKPTFGIFARDRSDKLAEFEQPNLTLLFNKILQG